jgi:hypothetical protein
MKTKTHCISFGLALLVASVLALPLRAADVSLFLCDANGNVGLIDLTTDTVTYLGSEGNGVVLHDLAYVPGSGALYGTSHTDFYQVSTTTGASTDIGAYGSLGGGEMDGLVTDGQYFLGSTGANGHIYDITASPYSITELTGSVGGESAGDLAYGSDGTLYDAVLTSDIGYLWKVNISNMGVVTGSEVGEFSLGLGIVGMALGSDGVLYGVDKTEVYSIDPSDAHLTEVMDFSGHRLGNAEGLTAIIKPAPEPPTIWLIAVGGLVFALCRKWRLARFGQSSSTLRLVHP